VIFHFSLYGFLKNQRYFEPFFLLALLEKGLSYFEIGLLVGFRGLMVNLLEVPTGVIADAYGKRTCMMISFAAYCISFILFGAGVTLPVLFAAMLLFSLGEAFRTGTHKAIIFEWLEREGRMHERDRVYGFTRSWSKFGSAVSAIIAAVLVIIGNRYSRVFYYSVIPYLIGLINFTFYPPDSPVEQARKTSFWKLFRESVADAFRQPLLRGLLAEAALYEGPYKVVKDYVQPILKTAALTLPLLAGWSDVRRTAVLVGAVFVLLHLFEGVASRKSADFVEKWCGGLRPAVLRLWTLNLAACTVLTVAILLGFPALAVVCFVALAALQNLWRPNMIGRLSEASPAHRRATVLSINSQLDSLVAFVVAPVVGFLVDHSGGNAWASGATPAILAATGVWLARANLARTPGRRTSERSMA